MPAVADRLRTMTSVIQTGTTAHAVGLAQLMREMSDVKKSLADFLTGSFSLTFTPRRSRLLPQGYDSIYRRQKTPPSPTPALPTSLGGPALDAGTPAPPANLAAEKKGHTPLFKLSREVQTIPDLWREWTVGLGGLPSVDSLDAQFGCRWRSATERQYYSTRKVIVDEIRARGQGNREAEEKAVQAMELERLASKASLDKVMKAIRKARGARKV
jgi:hypothetical protein